MKCQFDIHLKQFNFTSNNSIILNFKQFKIIGWIHIVSPTKVLHLRWASMTNNYALETLDSLREILDCDILFVKTMIIIKRNFYHVLFVQKSSKTQMIEAYTVKSPLKNNTKIPQIKTNYHYNKIINL